MSMQRTIQVITQLASIGVIKSYALTGAVDLDLLAGVLRRYDLVLTWRAFCFKAGRTDPLQ